MKKVMWSGAVLLLLSLFVVLFIRSAKNVKQHKIEVFLFDTVCSIAAYGDQAEEAVDAAVSRLSEIHLATDFYSDNSELTKINNAKANEEIKVSDDMAAILDAALNVGKDSDSAFDITVASVTKLWDFKNEGSVPAKEQIEEALQFVGQDDIVFDKTNMTVKKNRDGVIIDLGGVAKGYGGDVALEVMRGFLVSGAIVDLGGNITCFGENPNSEDGIWRIGLQKPFAPTGEYGQVVDIYGGAAVTCGTYQRYFEKDGQQYHHIIDPSTGYPVQRQYSSVTIVTNSGVVADCLATACFVLGEEKGRALAEKYEADIYFN